MIQSEFDLFQYQVPSPKSTYRVNFVRKEVTAIGGAFSDDGISGFYVLRPSSSSKRHAGTAKPPVTKTRRPVTRRQISGTPRFGPGTEESLTHHGSDRAV